MKARGINEMCSNAFSIPKPSQREVLQGLMESKTLVILLKLHLQYFLSRFKNINNIYISRLYNISFHKVLVLIKFAY